MSAPVFNQKAFHVALHFDSGFVKSQKDLKSIETIVKTERAQENYGIFPIGQS